MCVCLGVCVCKKRGGGGGVRGRGLDRIRTGQCVLFSPRIREGENNISLRGQTIVVSIQHCKAQHHVCKTDGKNIVIKNEVDYFTAKMF